MDNESFGSKAKRMIKRIIWVVVILGIGALCYLYWGTSDDGVRAGFVLRISKKGYLFKTYEGTLNTETFGANKRANPIVETFDFSVDSDHEEVIKELEAVALSGERVNLRYIKRFKAFPWRGDSKYFVTKVERQAKK